MSSPSRLRWWTEQVPPIAFRVQEHGDCSIRLLPGRSDEAHACCVQPLIRCVKVINAQEQGHPPRELVACGFELLLPVSAGQENACLGSRRAHHNPPFRATIVSERGAVLRQLEPEHGHEEIDSRILVAHDEGEEMEVRHAVPLYAERPREEDARHPNVNANTSTPESRNSISNCRSAIEPDCRIS